MVSSLAISSAMITSLTRTGRARSAAPAFCLEHTSDRQQIQGIGNQGVERVSRNCDQPTFANNVRRAFQGLRTWLFRVDLD